MPYPKTPLLVRFLRKVNKDGPVPPHMPDLGPCWLWTGQVRRDGYGDYRKHTPERMTHRLSWHIEHGPVPEGLEVCHRCDVRLCVRPSHLFTGTQSDNMLDASSKRRHPAQAPGRRKGEGNGRHLLSDADVLAIRLSTERSGILAGRFGVSVTHIRRVKTGVAWSHLTEAIEVKVAR